MVLSITAVAADLGTDAYRLPLVDSYAIYRVDKSHGVDTENGLYQLVEIVPSSAGVGLATRTLVAKVESVAFQDRFIFGKSADGFFILDARYPDQRPHVVSTRDEWETALRGSGITDSNLVKAPDSLAAGLSEQVLRPWKYRVMGSRFGISDDAWSLVVQLLGFAIAFVMGFAWPPGKSPMGVAIVLGLIVNVIAQILIAGGGPGALAGFIALPVLCVLAAALGKGLRAITSTGRPTSA